MKTGIKKLLTVLKYIVIVSGTLILLLLLARIIGKQINSITPDGGINDSGYVPINGQEMWINIYGRNKDAPLLLFLHGGPGNSYSYVDYVLLRKLADDYIVVNWDQRCCGRTWLRNKQDTDDITLEMMQKDIDEMADFLLECFGREKLTVMGISWGSYYGLDFVNRHPEKTACYIGLSQTVGTYEGEAAYCMSYWTISAEYLKTSEKLSEEDYALAQKIDTAELENELVNGALYGPSGNKCESKDIFFRLYKKYRKDTDRYMTKKGYSADMISECDENLVAAAFFSPYYTIPEIFDAALNYSDDHYTYLERELRIPENGHTFLDKTDYSCPVYFFLAENDISCDPKMAEKYFDSINAPDKLIRFTKGAHESTMLHSDELADFVHEIAERQKDNANDR